MLTLKQAHWQLCTKENSQRVIASFRREIFKGGNEYSAGRAPQINLELSLLTVIVQTKILESVGREVTKHDKLSSR